MKYLPKVISMTEFKVDTNKGKYAYILNGPTHNFIYLTIFFFCLNKKYIIIKMVIKICIVI